MIKNFFLNKQKMIYMLIVTSILMLISLFIQNFIQNAKIAGCGLTLWIFSVFWNVYLILKSNNMNYVDVVSKLD